MNKKIGELEENRYYIHLRKGVYVTFYADHLILLDTNTDFFFNSFDIAERDFILLFNNGHIVDEGQEKCVSSIIQRITDDLLKKKLIEFYNNSFLDEKLYLQPKLNFFKTNNGYNQGTNISWDLQNHNFAKAPKWMIVRFICLLAKTHLISKLYGFRGIVRTIQKSYKSKSKKYNQLKIPKDQELSILVDSLNSASLIFPIRTKCLEWATSLVLMALKNGWLCNLVVGVQNYPFASHAWVESNKKVLADVGSLPKNLAIILKEPICCIRDGD